MARADTPAFRQIPGGRSRRVMSVAELERLYGRDAQVELQAPVTHSPDLEQDFFEEANDYNNYDDYDEPVDVPVRRSPWLPVVIVLMLGLGGLLGLGLHRRGMVPGNLAQLSRSNVSLSPTDELPAHSDWAPPPALPVVTVQGATPSTLVEPAQTASDIAEPSADEAQTATATARAEPATSAAVKPAAAQARPSTRRAARSARSEDEAATLEAIRKERDAVEGSSQQTPPKSDNPYVEPASPPGYVEADTP